MCRSSSGLDSHSWALRFGRARIVRQSSSKIAVGFTQTPKFSGSARGSELPRCASSGGLPCAVQGLCHGSVAWGIANRAGAGTLKHLMVKQLLAQQALVGMGRVSIGRVPRTNNSADAFTLTHVQLR